jgi:hypothetical protein
MSTRAQREGWDTAPTHSQRGTEWSFGGQHNAPAALRLENRPSTDSTGCWVVLDGDWKSAPAPCSVQPVAGGYTGYAIQAVVFNRIFV